MKSIYFVVHHFQILLSYNFRWRSVLPANALCPLRMSEILLVSAVVTYITFFQTCIFNLLVNCVNPHVNRRSAFVGGYPPSFSCAILSQHALTPPGLYAVFVTNSQPFAFHAPLTLQTNTQAVTPSLPRPPKKHFLPSATKRWAYTPTTLRLRSSSPQSPAVTPACNLLATTCVLRFKGCNQHHTQKKGPT